jgi:hypothetical protein
MCCPSASSREWTDRRLPGFNLREGVSDLDVAAAFSAYTEHLRGQGLILSWRLMRRKLDLGPEMLRESELQKYEPKLPIQRCGRHRSNYFRSI